VGNSAGQALTGLSASVEQIAALVCNLLVAAAADPAVEKRLAAEQAAVLKGAAPDAPITAEVLAQMPQLDAFVQETLRTAAPTQPLGDGSASRGAQAAISMAKAVYVQLHRMFDVVLSESPPCRVGGSPLRTVPEGSEVLMKPRMYYELQRGVKKLKF